MVMLCYGMVWYGAMACYSGMLPTRTTHSFTITIITPPSSSPSSSTPHHSLPSYHHHSIITTTITPSSPPSHHSPSHLTHHHTITHTPYHTFGAQTSIDQSNLTQTFLPFSRRTILFLFFHSISQTSYLVFHDDNSVLS